MDPRIIAVCAAIGGGAGVAFGAAIKNIPMGMLVGLAGGLVIGIIISAVKNNCTH